MVTLTKKALIIAGCILALIGFLVALGGIAKLAADCATSSTVTNCSQAQQYEWWGIWFNFFLVLAILALACYGNFNWNTTMQAFLAACLSVTMFDARSALDRQAFGLGNLSTELDGPNVLGTQAAIDAAAAGFILMSIADFLLIIFLGIDAATTVISMQLPSLPARNKASTPTKGPPGSDDVLPIRTKPAGKGAAKVAPKDEAVPA